MRVKPGSRIFTHQDLQRSSQVPNSLQKLANNNIKMHAILYPINQLQVDTRSATFIVQAWRIFPSKPRIKQQISCEDLKAHYWGKYRRVDQFHDSLFLTMANNEWLFTTHWNVPLRMNSLHFLTFGSLKSMFHALCLLTFTSPHPQMIPCQLFAPYATAMDVHRQAHLLLWENSQSWVFSHTMVIQTT